MSTAGTADPLKLPRDSFLLKSGSSYGGVKGDEALSRLTQTLAPSRRFLDRCEAILSQLTIFVRQQSTLNINAALVGGSIGKGTALNDKSDIDVIMFVGGLRDMNEYLARHDDVKSEFGAAFRRWKDSRYLRLQRVTVMAVTVKMRTSVFDDFIDVDVIPTFDNLSNHASLIAIYAEMDRRSTELERYAYGSSLTPMQIDFVRRRTQRCPGLVDIIRLVKYWKKTHFKKIESSLNLRMPSSYVIELIVIHLWEKADSPGLFSLDTAFKAVMMSLVRNSELFVYWTDYYDPNMYRHRATRTANKPFVMDPSNPFNNVCDFYSVDAWNLISRLAAASCDSPLLRNIGSCGVHWN